MEETQLSKGLQTLEKGVLQLPTTANEIYVFVRDTMMEKTKELALEVEMLQKDSLAQEVTDEATAGESRNIILRKKEIVESITAVLGGFKEKAHKVHAGVCSAEKLLLAPLTDIENTEKRKIGTFVLKEQERKKAEWLAEQDRLQKEKDKKIKAAQKKADELLAGVTDLAKQAEALEKQLEHPEITQEEVDALESKLAGIRAQLNSKQASLNIKTGQVQDLSRSTPAPLPTAAVKIEGTGVKKVYKATIVAPMQLLQAIVNGIVPISVVEFNTSQLNKFTNGGGVPAMMANGVPAVPGCLIEDEMKVSTRRV